jgi:transposase
VRFGRTGVIPNRPESVRKLIGNRGRAKQMKACHEAGPTGYVLCWQLAQLGVTGCSARSFARSSMRSGSRQERPTEGVGYSGLVAREHSSGNRIQRGSITKTGNAHLRRVLVEAAWAYQHRPNVTGFLLRRQKTLALSDDIKQIAWKAQYRLHKRYKAFAARGKNKNQIVTALGRELLGFIWAIATTTEEKQKLAAAG